MDSIQALERILESSASGPMREAALRVLEGQSYRQASAAAGAELRNLRRFCERHGLAEIHETRRLERNHQQAEAQREVLRSFAGAWPRVGAGGGRQSV